MAPSKGMEEKDNPVIVFSGETKDWSSFKDAIQMGVDKHTLSGYSRVDDR